MSDRVLIWSGEHRAYWRAKGKGYTTLVADAGLWWRPEAEAAIAHCDASKRLHLHSILAVLDNTEPRDLRQHRVATWRADAFGAGQAASVEQRGLRLAEEAIEAAHSAGCEAAALHKLIDYIFARPPGELAQELGGVGVTLLALAEAAGRSADFCEQAEIARVLSKPLEHFTTRNQSKNDAGFIARGVS